MAHQPKSNKMKREDKLRRESMRRKKKDFHNQNSPLVQKAREEARIQKAIDILSASKAGTRNPKETLKAIYGGKKVYLTNSSPLRSYLDLFNEITNKDEKEALFRLLNHCLDQNATFIDKSRITNNRSFKNALKGVAAFHDFWIRPLEDWKATSYNTNRQFSSLLRHLFGKYNIPSFMDDAFFVGNALQQDWFIHIGAGNNIRTAPRLPIPLTKKSAHLMMEAPDDFDINGALRWGQIKSMGGDERLIRAILKTRIGNIFTDNEFWESVFRWFMENPMLDTEQYAPIIDYIYHQKFIASVPNEDPTGPFFVPPQPNMSMKKRDVAATIKAMEEWHKQTGRNRSGDKHDNNWWASSGIPEFFYEEGESQKRIYSITELLTVAELKQEGEAMHHCVGSYSYSCSSGRCSVWSMKVRNPDNSLVRLLTLEVDNSSRSIRQSRGKYNALPNIKSNDIMNRWATAAGLTVSRWLI
jgi:hypothetical protein